VKFEHQELSSEFPLTCPIGVTLSCPTQRKVCITLESHMSVAAGQSGKLADDAVKSYWAKTMPPAQLSNSLSICIV
jgi:hypothetical protein